MTHRTKGKHGTPPQSRHVRDLAVLQRSRILPLLREAPERPEPTGTQAAGRQVKLFSLNWQAAPDQPLVNTRPLQSDELPAVQDPALRALIDATALGLPISASLHQALLRHEAEALEAAIAEGIRRWRSAPDF